MGAIRRLKRLVGTTRPADYECRGCGAAFAVQYYTCPECGSYSVERSPEIAAE